jgi:predicted  nucleic acid-binding Zn-ribbon protein
MKAALTKFACLDCRKVFKRPADASRRTCPHCGSEAQRVGSDFKAPAMRDATAWAVASFLIARGFPYYRLGFPYPTTMADAEAFVATHASKAVSE